MNSRIPLTVPIIDNEMIERGIHALQNEKLVMGESVHKFEEEFANYIGVKFAISTNSGTSALDISFDALRLKQGQEVIVPSATFISTVSGPVTHGAKPMFADISPNSYTINPEEVRRKVSSRTSAIVPVHLYGYPADMNAILEFASENNLIVVEDVAQAHGAMLDGRKTGSLGHIGIFSFYPTKNMTVGGDGGMITTDNEEIARTVMQLRDVGRLGRYRHGIFGHALRLNNVNAAIGRVQLRNLDKWNERRREIAALYDKILSQIEDIQTPPRPNGRELPVYHLYVIRILNGARNALAAWLIRHNVEALIHYAVPVHMQPACINYADSIKLPNTEEWAKGILSIPMHPSLEDDQARYVAELLYEFFNKSLYNDSELKKAGEDWYNQLM